MPEITFAQAREFLDNINSEDKVAVIHHDDGDGICSGILYYDWCKLKNAKTEHFTYQINRSKLKDFELEKFDKIIICDVAPYFIGKESEIIKNKQVLYADHHPRDTPIAEEILELVTVTEGYIPSSRTAGELTGLKPWLSLIGTITDSGELYAENQNFIDKYLEVVNMTLDKFKENVSSVVTNFLVYFNEDMGKAFTLLREINSIEEIENLRQYSEQVENEVQKFVKEYEEKKERLGDVNFYYFEPNFSVKGPVSGIISHQDQDEAYIFATPKEEGKYITLSARNTSQKINMADLLKAGVDGLEEGSAGGHVPAAGGICLVKDINKFKQNIRKFLENRKS